MSTQAATLKHISRRWNLMLMKLFPTNNKHPAHISFKSKFHIQGKKQQQKKSNIYMLPDWEMDVTDTKLRSVFSIWT